MGETLLFCFVFLSQIFWMSAFFPMRAWRRGKYVLENCPPSTHPKLYAKPVEWHVRVLRTFMGLNVALVLAGVAIIVALIVGKLGGQWDGSIVTPWSTSGEWDAAIVTPFFMLQLVPMMYIQFSTVAHYKAMAKTPPPAVRTAQLRRRRIVDFASPALLATSVLTYLAYIAFVLYYKRFEFPWFTAWGNIAAVTFAFAAFAAGIVFAVHGRSLDHHQGHEKRLDAIRMVVKYMLIASIGTPVAVATQLSLKALLGPEVLEPVIASLMVQIVGLFVLWRGYSAHLNKGDYDVYRQDAQTT